METETLTIEAIRCCANCMARHGTYQNMTCGIFGRLFSVLPHWLCEHFEDNRGAESWALDVQRAQADAAE